MTQTPQQNPEQIHTADRDKILRLIAQEESPFYRHNILDELELVTTDYMKFVATVDYHVNPLQPAHTVEWVRPVQETLIGLTQSSYDRLAETSIKQLVVLTSQKPLLYALYQDADQTKMMSYLEPVRDAFINAALTTDDKGVQMTALFALSKMAFKNDVLNWVPEDQRLSYVIPVQETYIKMAGKIMPAHDDIKQPLMLVYEAMADRTLVSMLGEERTTYVSHGMDLVTQAYAAADGQDKEDWGIIKTNLVNSHQIAPFLTSDSLERAGYLNIDGKSGDELREQTEIWLDYLGNHPEMTGKAMEQLNDRSTKIVSAFYELTDGLVLDINDNETLAKLTRLKTDYEFLNNVLQHERLSGAQIS